jgi:hypothetical protein
MYFSIVALRALRCVWSVFSSWSVLLTGFFKFPLAGVFVSSFELLKKILHTQDKQLHAMCDVNSYRKPMKHKLNAFLCKLFEGSWSLLQSVDRRGKACWRKPTFFTHIYSTSIPPPPPGEQKG